MKLFCSFLPLKNWLFKNLFHIVACPFHVFISICVGVYTNSAHYEGGRWRKLTLLVQLNFFPLLNVFIPFHYERYADCFFKNLFFK